MTSSSAAAAAVASWAALPVHGLDCPPAHLDLEHSLDCGQAFRWRREDGAWVGVVGPRVFRIWRTETGELHWQAWPDDDDPLDDLAAYLRIEIDLDAVRRELCTLDPRMTVGFESCPGLRVLRQPAEEALLTFVCSPASNIVRITRSIDLLARGYGPAIAIIANRAYHAFPSAAVIAERSAEELTSALGLGFRGRGLRAASAEVVARTPDWTGGLADWPHEQARQALISLPAVGPKIADCVALFGLGHDQAVPVDTHVWGLARELFGGRFAQRTLTTAVYDEVRQAFYDRFGRWAGWAQQYLYHARRLGRSLPLPSEVRLLDA